jgi:anti-sigma regulatory factor (Ser/Thr protein kinase)
MAKRADLIKQSLVYHIFWSARSPVSEVAAEFGVTHQAVQLHLQSLVRNEAVLLHGSRRHVGYQLAPLERHRKAFPLNAKVTEELVWATYVSPLVSGLGSEDVAICNYGLTEIFNNAIDHSAGTKAIVTVQRTAASVEIEIADNGEGIFMKICSALRLHDLREAFLELSKGKFTTDPKRHTGEGIFFSARLFDRFTIDSDTFTFCHTTQSNDWHATDHRRKVRGTRITMELLIPTRTVMGEVLSRFSSGLDDYRFAKTRIPVKLAAFNDEPLTSRASAKRVLSRADRFEELVMDFTGVRSIGQAFADEIFRVFAAAHPKIDLVPINASIEVTQMIRRAQAAGLDSARRS